MAIVAHEKGRTCPECGFGNSQRSNKCVVCGHGLPKHRNDPIFIDEIRFASKKEAKRYQELWLAKKEGTISDLKVHPIFDIELNGVHLTRYIADFSYRSPVTKTLMVEDVKGARLGPAYGLFALKKRLMKAILNIEVQEVL